HRHDEAELAAGRDAELADLDRVALEERLAGVEEQERTQRAEHVEVVLGVEEAELVAAEHAALRVGWGHAADVVAPDLGLAAQEVALVERQHLGVAVLG